MNKSGQLVAHRRRGIAAALITAAAVLSALGGCTSMRPYRTVWPAGPLDCSADRSGLPPPQCANSMLESAANGPYDLLFLEFDDQGLQYPDPSDYNGANADEAVGEARQQMNLAMGYLQKLGDQHQKLSIVVFVHGWKNNAAADNDNVKSFRQLLASLAVAEQATEGRRVVGLYVSWRGLSATFEPFKELSFWDRKNTAQYVAGGSVRALFARLKGFQCSRNSPGSREGCRARKAGESPSVRTLFIGHSFGGMVLYSAIAEDLIDSLTYDVDRGGKANPVARFGDMVVLLNPAFEGTRYTPLYRAAQRATTEGPYDRYQTPIFVAITTDADWATKYAFPFGRFFNSVFEQTASEEELEANRNTMGHIPQYITHTLTKTDKQPCADWSSAADAAAGGPEGPTPSPEQRKEQIRKNLDAEQKNTDAFFQRTLVDGKLPAGWQRDFCGGTVLKQQQPKGTPSDPNSPIWNVSTDATVMTGHNDITNPALIDFVRQLYQECSQGSSAKTVCGGLH